MKTYKPLPKSVAIKDSAIHGQGFQNNYIRTPLGGFINHSDDPNCGKTRSHSDSTLTYYILHTIKNIEEGEELTLNYTMYII